MRAPRTPYWTWSLGSIRTRKNTELTEDVYMCIEKNVHSACGFDTPPIRIRYGWHSLIRDKWAHFQSLYILSLAKLSWSNVDWGRGTRPPSIATVVYQWWVCPVVRHVR